jgi:hypothetical protein
MQRSLWTALGLGTLHTSRFTRQYLQWPGGAGGIGAGEGGGSGEGGMGLGAGDGIGAGGIGSGRWDDSAVPCKLENTLQVIAEHNNHTGNGVERLMRDNGS